jgi:hypothetical protein
MDGIGLAGWDGHTDKETGDLSKLAMLSKRAALLLNRVTRAASP